MENVRWHVAELKRRNAEAQKQARADLPRLVKAIRADDRVRRAYLFGSLAKGMFHPRGDIDIAVEGLDFREMAKLQERLAALTEFPVDLRDLDSTPEFRELVEFYGEVLYARPRRFARITHGRGMVGGCSEAGEGGAQEVSL